MRLDVGGVEEVHASIDRAADDRVDRALIPPACGSVKPASLLKGRTEAKFGKSLPCSDGYAVSAAVKLPKLKHIEVSIAGLPSLSSTDIGSFN
jgi:hypothetical protein